MDYVRLADSEQLTKCDSPTLNRPAVVLVAARLGDTRLIDNAVLGEDVLR